MRYQVLFALAILFSPFSQAMALTTGPIEAFTASTIRPDGPRQFNGALSELFFNVEGVNNGQFANYGVLRFDLGSIDLSNSIIDSVQLDLFESNASFTTNGNVAAYFSDLDSIDIASAGTANVAYKASFTNTPFEDDFTDALFLGGDFFEETGNGDLEGYTIVQNLQAFADDDSIITIVLAEFNDPDVAATYGGIGNQNGTPTLTINYTVVPVPAAVWFLGSGLMMLAGFSSRKK